MRHRIRRAHSIVTTSIQLWFNDLTLSQRWIDVVQTSCARWAPSDMCTQLWLKSACAVHVKKKRKKKTLHPKLSKMRAQWKFWSDWANVYIPEVRFLKLRLIIRLSSWNNSWWMKFIRSVISKYFDSEIVNNKNQTKAVSHLVSRSTNQRDKQTLFKYTENFTTKKNENFQK